MKLLQFLISPGFSPLSIPINYVPPQDNDNASVVHFPYLHEQAQGTTKLDLTSPHDLPHECQQMIFPNATLEKNDVDLVCQSCAKHVNVMSATHVFNSIVMVSRITTPCLFYSNPQAIQRFGVIHVFMAHMIFETIWMLMLLFSYASSMVGT
jgi:phenylpropionate dioxygenase-like ring-hydroxylating dioxygenase large terminal subunit